jgi:hypothetical protein
MTRALADVTSGETEATLPTKNMATEMAILPGEEEGSVSCNHLVSFQQHVWRSPALAPFQRCVCRCSSRCAAQLRGTLRDQAGILRLSGSRQPVRNTEKEASAWMCGRSFSC